VIDRRVTTRRLKHMKITLPALKCLQDRQE
jgi:hypothetical protein